MSDSIRESYDKVLYPCDARPAAHPNRLATLATLFGIEPPDIAHCRMLEIGCGDGTHSLSVAHSLPEAQCVAIDLADVALELGRQTAAAVGLDNVELVQKDLMDIGPEFGRFDYIVAHGVFSWVPEPVRQRLLDVCRQNLSPNGVAYISYNAYPGGHFRDMTREMMRFHVSHMEDPQQQIEQARALLAFIADSSDQPDLYRGIVRTELKRISEYADGSLFHDDLAEFNTPFYFYRFMEQAERHGLQFLAEASIAEMQAWRMSPQVLDTVNRMADSLIAREQYLDFIRCRRFRRTLLCHADLKLDPPKPERLKRLWVAAPLQVKEGAGDGQITFAGADGAEMTTADPFVRSAFETLRERWPHPIRFPELVERARAISRSERGAEPEFQADAETLGLIVLRGYSGGTFSLDLQPSRFVSEVSERPVASPLARVQSRSRRQIPTLRHNTITVENPLVRYLLGLLDGTRDRQDLERVLIEWIGGQGGVLQKDGKPVTDPAAVAQVVAEGLPSNLQFLADESLLLA